MFQYAFAFALSKTLNVETVLDFTWFEAVKNHTNVTPRKFELGAFKTDYAEASEEDLKKVVSQKNSSLKEKILWSAFKLKKFKPKKNKVTQIVAHKFYKNLMTQKDYYYYDGYFQNEKYFIQQRAQLLEQFSLREELDGKNQELLNKIFDTNSVSLHVRRGDYVTLECAKNQHGLCPIKYYEKAIKHIEKRVKNPHFYLFSDDLDWVVENLEINHPFKVVDLNKNKGAFDLELMKHCKHNITANSSFSWWGAWLNENPNKIVISPKKWNSQKQKCEIVPKSWVKL